MGATLGLISWLTAAVSGAVDATLTPSTTSSSATTPVVLHVTGLTNGGSVIVERYVDADADGVVAVGEFLAETYTVTDGQVTSIGGVRNTNMPGDEDLTADGQISINVLPALGSELGRVAGSHLIRISSPIAAFTTFIRTLTLTNPAQAQSISGTVTDGTDPVPYASVILLDAATDGEFALGVITNASGVYTAPAPAGSYMVLPFKYGYVASFPSPTVLAAAATPTQNLVMTAATRSIAGEVADAGTNAGLGGVQLFVQSMSDQVTIISTSADGTYSVPVTADQWQIETSEVSIRQLGYLNFQNSNVTADTSVSSVTGADVDVVKATALIHGTVEDAGANPLAGIRVNANDSNHTYYSDATTDANGNYVLGVTSGSWNVSISNESPGLAGYIVPNGQSATISGAQAVQRDFTMIAVNAHLAGTVMNNGVPVPSIQLGAYNQSTSQFIMVETALDGTFDLGLVAGTWMVQLNSQSAALANLVSSSVNYTLAENDNVTGITFQVKTSTAQITGLVLDGDNGNQAISNANVYATATISTVLYNANVQTDVDGNYSLPVVNGTWQVGAFASGYTNTNSVTENVSGPNVSRDFILTKGPVIAFHPMDHTATAGQTFVFSVSANGNSVSYQWQVSIDSGNTWNNLSNDSTYSTVTSNVLNVASTIGLNGYRYRCVATNGFGSAASNSALLTVNAANIAPSFSLHPSNQTVTAGQNANFNVSASGTPAPTLQWQESIDDGNNWSNLTNGSAYSGVTSTTLTVNATIIGQDGYRYRAMATNTAGSPTSNVAILTVNPPNVAPGITSDPSNQTVTAGLNASFSVSANGSPSPTFQWQVSTDSGSNWSNLTDDANYNGTGTGLLQVTATTIGQNGNLYRAVATNVAGFANSNSALLTVNAANVAPNITADPANQTVTAGQNAVFSVTANGTPAPTYQWEVSTDGGSNWSTLANDANYSGVTTTTLTVTATIVGQNTYLYRAVATNVAGSANSNSALLTVNAANVAPGFTTQPSNQTVTAGQNASFTVAADGTPVPSFQWQVSTDSGTNWNNLANDATYSGVTTTTLTVTATIIGQNGYLYRAVATNIAGSVNSNSAQLTVNAVNPAPSITTNPSNQAVNAGQTATFWATATGTPTPTYQWQVSTDGGTNWTNLANDYTYVGTATNTLTVIISVVGLNGYQYRAVATNTAGSANSAAASLTVNVVSPLNTLHHFGSFTDGINPAVTSSLTLSGNTLYGTTIGGGVNYKGTVFSIQTNGNAFSVMHSFSALSIDGTNADGELPYCTLTFAAGKLYGTATSGGSLGNGTLYSINPDGTGFTTHFNFAGSELNSSYAKHSPVGRLTLEGGNLYGVTAAGGNPVYDGSVNGKLFAYNLSGGLTFPYVYPDMIWDGNHIYTPYNPGRGLVHLNGKLYGTTLTGGYDGYGTVFSVNANGTGYTTLHTFMNTDGANPLAPIVLSGDMLYGTTKEGGANNLGVIFTIKIDGSAFSVLHSFNGAQGFANDSGLLVVGNTLYGSTAYGGTYGFGTIFSLNTNGTGYTILHSFNRFVDGSFPGGLIREGNVIYGMTATGGSHDYGTIFSFVVSSLSADYSSWTQAYFTSSELLDANVSGPNAVLGLDGLTNLVKYALGLDPTIDATAGLPEVSTTATDWVYTYTRPVDRTDITYAVEVSTNLTTWGAPATVAVLISTVGNVETWQAKHPLASATNAYFRLKVTEL